jgi:hypothetical protein
VQIPEPLAVALFALIQIRYLLAFDVARNTNVLSIPRFGLLRAPPEALEMRLDLEELWLDHNRLETIPAA